jgi:hypothetical protein
MLLHPPDYYAHVSHHNLVKLFTKSTEAIFDDDNLTGNLSSESLVYDIRFWVGIQSILVHWVTTIHQMDPLTEQVLVQTTTIVLSGFHVYGAILKATAIHFEE